MENQTRLKIIPVLLRFKNRVNIQKRNEFIAHVSATTLKEKKQVLLSDFKNVWKRTFN